MFCVEPSSSIIRAKLSFASIKWPSDSRLMKTASGLFMNNA